MLFVFVNAHRGFPVGEQNFNSDEYGLYQGVVIVMVAEEQRIKNNVGDEIQENDSIIDTLPRNQIPFNGSSFPAIQRTFECGIRVSTSDAYKA